MTHTATAKLARTRDARNRRAALDTARSQEAGTFEQDTHSTHADAVARSNTRTARLHLMETCVDLAEHHPQITHLDWDITDCDPDVLTGMEPLRLSDAFDANGESITVAKPLVPGFDQGVYGADDGNTAWDEFSADGRISVARVLEAVDALPTPENHTVIVAFDVRGTSSMDAQQRLMRALPACDSDPVESWWIAQDEREDGSDCNSAVFIDPGQSEHANAALYALGLATDTWTTASNSVCERCPQDSTAYLTSDGWCTSHGDAHRE